MWPYQAAENDHWGGGGGGFPAGGGGGTKSAAGRVILLPLLFDGPFTILPLMGTRCPFAYMH